MEAFEASEVTDITGHVLDLSVECCDLCGGKLIDTGETVSKDEFDVVIDVVKRRHEYHIYQCADCGATVRMQIEKKLKEKNQYGSNVQALALSLMATGNSGSAHPTRPACIYIFNFQGTPWQKSFCLFWIKSFLDLSAQKAHKHSPPAIELIKAKGYEVKGENFGEKAHKFISFRPLDRERFVRGSAKSLGAEYTKERIKERITEKTLAKDKKRVPFPVRKKPVVKDYSRRNLIDTTEDKFTQSPGLKHWADI